MVEYIERNKVIELLKGTEVNGTPYMKRIVKATVDLAIEAISDDVPAADVAPVVHAKWIMKDVSGEIKAVCTHCGKPNKQYQPQCGQYGGAKMDEEENNG